MKETTRTLAFVGVAIVTALLAVATQRMSGTTQLQEFEKVGQEFFADFTDPNEAKSIDVTVYNEDTASIKDFSVHFQDGLWRIPSHHNYPADAEDQLAETAASVIGLQRDALAGRRDSDHERLGVIDPLDDDNTLLKGRGQRVKFSGANGEVLADYIIGKESEEGSDKYYVRRPDEKETYLVQLDINLSTTFADWIEDDLLKLDRNKLKQVTIDRYSVDEASGRISPHDISQLTRDKSVDPWKLEGLNEETEELQDSNINQLVSNLDDLKITGVRPKPQGIRSNLTIDTDFVRSQDQLNMLVSEMASKGFLIAENEDGSRRIVSNEGEVSAATEEGIVYNLRFGDVFTGSEFEIETGFTKNDDKKAEAEQAAAESEENSDNAEEESPESEGVKRSRYLLVSASFDETQIPLPEEPIKPTPPESVTQPEQPAEESESSADEANGDESVEATEADGDAAEDKASESADDAAAKAQADYEAALAKYEQDMETYKRDLDARAEQVKEGQELAQQLNTRFEKWYYVISADSFEKIRLSREEIVKAKEKEEGTDELGDSAPGPVINQPANTPAASPEPATDSESNTTPPKSDESAVEPESSTEGETPTPEGESASPSEPPSDTADNPDAANGETEP